MGHPTFECDATSHSRRCGKKARRFHLHFTWDWEQQLDWCWLLYDTSPFIGQRRGDIAQGNAVVSFSPVTCRRHSRPPLVRSLRVGVPGVVLEFIGCIAWSVRVKSGELQRAWHTLHHGRLGRVDAVGNDRS